MSLMPSIIAFVVALLFSVAARGVAQESSLAMSQQAARLMAFQLAEVRLAQVASLLSASEPADDDIQALGSVENVLSSPSAELQDLPLTMQRITVVGASGVIQVRLQADFVVDGCESAHDVGCVPRVRRIAWRQLPAD